jgi:uncharacterized protein (DUF924 family)
MSTPEPALEVVQFWKDAGWKAWFAKDDAFDAKFRSAFLARHEAAARGELGAWEATAEGALALLILLDQFPRNCFRDTPRMFATDSDARAIADRAIAAGHDKAVDKALRVFFYLPFSHSEQLADQDRSVALNRELGGETLRHAELHRDVIRKFGRFPFRNAALGRDTTVEEQAYLDGGGYRA